MGRLFNCLLTTLGLLGLVFTTVSARWSREFESRPDFRTEVLSVTSFDGRLIVGGYFAAIDGTPARSVAAWDGVRWQSVGSGLGNGVFAFTTLDGALIAAGSFQYGERIPSRVATWDGTNWLSLGAGPSAPVSAVTVHDGHVVVACSNQSSVGAGEVEEWDGTEWRSMGGPLEGMPTAVLSRDGRLFVAGLFPNGVLEWDGQSWVPVGDLSGSMFDLIDTPAGLVATTARYGDESGGPGYPVARLEGTQWVPLLGPSTPAQILASGRFGDRVVVAGRLQSDGALGVFEWDGDGWRALGDLPLRNVFALCEHEGELVACGQQSEDGVYRNTVVSWNGSVWKWPQGETAPLGAQGPDEPVSALLVDGDELVVAGGFGNVAGIRSRQFARWSSRGWSAFEREEDLVLRGTNVSEAYQALVASGQIKERDSTQCSIGVGPEVLFEWRGDLYCGARMSGGPEIRRGSSSYLQPHIVGRWVGTRWECVGGVGDLTDFAPNRAYALTAWNGALVVAGEFQVLHGVPCPGVAELEDGVWSPIGHASSLVGTGPFMGYPRLRALCVFEDQLICGGQFVCGEGTPGDERLGGVAVWNGSDWEPLGGGIDGGVNFLRVEGGRVLAAGEFTRAGLVLTSNIAAWDGGRWSALGAGLEGEVTALEIHRGQLVVAIHLRGPGGPARHGLRVWDGEEWLPFPSDPIFDGEIRALASFQGDLFVGGEFGHVGGQTSQYLARWVPD